MLKKELKTTEFNYFYATYLNMLKNDDELLTSLIEGKGWFVKFIKELSTQKLNYKYAAGKWTIAEVLIHLIDTERIFQYRAFRFSRNDMTPLPGFEQDGYVLECESEKRTKESIIEEFLSVREATIVLFGLMGEEKLRRIGMASSIPWSVAALGFVISGHQKHHLKILKERYFEN